MEGGKEGGEGRSKSTYMYINGRRKGRGGGGRSKSTYMYINGRRKGRGGEVDQNLHICT